MNAFLDVFDTAAAEPVMNDPAPAVSFSDGSLGSSNERKM